MVYKELVPYVKYVGKEGATLLEKATKKKISTKKLIQIILFCYALCSVALVLYLLDHMFSKELSEDGKKIVLSDGWNVLVNDYLYEDVNLDELRFDPLSKGDRVVLSKTLPMEWRYVEPMLCFHIRQTTVDMYIDNQIIYEYGHERYVSNDTVGSGIQLINFSNDNKGKELKIVLEVTEDNSFSRIDEIWISEWSDAYRLILAENRMPFFLGAFLVVFGIVVTTILIFVVAKMQQYMNILLLSIFAVCMGVWTLCYHNVILFFPIPLYSVSLIEYMTLFMAPLPIIGYMYSYVKQLENKRLMLIYKILFIVQSACTLISIILHSLDIVHAAGLLIYHHILFVIHSFFFAYILYRYSKENKSRKKLYSVGLVIVLGCIVYEMLVYILRRYFGYQHGGIKGVLSLGIIVFIIILVLDLYHDITIRKMEEHERKLLVKRAYTDELTSLNNRRFCTEYMNALDADENSRYTIVSFDLNNLKKTNDQYGHVQGDLLIKKAAEVIDKTFSDVAVVGRIGGDEFIAILSTEDKNVVEKLLQKLKKRVDEINDNIAELNLSISYGYAVRSEIQDNDTEKVYKLSDERMYEHKRLYKKMQKNK